MQKPAKEWLKLTRMVEETEIGQLSLFDETDKELLKIVEKIRKRREIESEAFKSGGTTLCKLGIIR